jgi:hypothetical protein
VYLNRASGGPAIYCPKNRLELLGLTNSLAGAAYTTVEQCYTWFQTQSDKAIFTKDVESVITDGLVLHLDPGFVESYPKSGATIYDLSGVGNHGSLNNGASLSTTSYSPQSRAARVYDGSGVTYVETGVAHEPSGSTEGFVLDGTDDIILFGASSAFMSQFHTYEAWIKTPGLGSNTVGGIFGINYGTIIYLTPSGEVFYYVWNTDPGHYEFLFSLYSTGVNLLDDQWHQIVCVRGPSEATIYIDGVFNNSTPNGGVWSGTTIWDGMTARIGENPNNVNLRFTGQIGPVRIYNRDLSADEVYTNYKQYESSYGNGVNTASLLLNFDDTLVLYNEDKILASFPGDGSADFSFSGGDGGTRVNQQGYIEQTPANLNTYSEYFATAGWNNYGGTITDNSVIAPSLAVTGTTFNGSPAGAYKTFYGIIPGQVYTASMYVKLGTATNCVIVINNTQNWNTIGGQSYTSGADGLNPDTWTRISRTFTGPASGAINWHIGFHYESGITQQSAGSFYTWGGMINIGSTAKPYQPTTDRLNYPRITYQNGRGALLSEPQRTNVNTYSQAIVAANGYNVDGCSLTANNAISPDGTQNATLFVESANSNYHRYYKHGTGTASTKVWTIFAKYKPGGREWLTMDAGPTVWFNIANGTIGTASGDIIAQIEPYKDGWYRCTYIDPTSAVNLCYVGAGTYNGDPGNYTGDSRDCFWLWGMQCEDSVLFPTSYIPTTSAAVTRPVEIFNNSSAISSIGQTEGTMFVDFIWTDLGASYPEIALYGTSGNRIGIYTWDQPAIGNNTLRAFVVGSGAVPFESDISNTLVRGQRYKAAFAYKSGDSVAYVNGVNTFTSGGTFTFSTALPEIRSTAAYPWSNNTHQFGLYTSRLTNSQLEKLTTVRSATGGTITYDGAYAIHTFIGDDVFTPNFNGTLEVMVVAGGGGGGMDMGGGGGAGGLIYTTSYPVTANLSLAVIVGAGGAGAPAGGGGYRTDGAGPQPGGHQFTISATNGSDSTFGSLSTRGGGYGASSYYGYLPNYGYGGTGGSGGGCSAYTHGGERYVDNNNIPGQGYPGGNSGNPASGADDHYSGGGGGAGARGTSGPNHVAPSGAAAHGGEGIIIPSLSPYWYAGGGGGSCYSGSKGGDGGKGGGGGAAAGGNGNTVGYGDTNGRNAAGNGALGNNAPGGNGGANTGGGGGGGSHYNWNNKGGEGGSGIIIVRYLI